MSERTITLTSEQMTVLRNGGHTFDRGLGHSVRLVAAGGPYSPLPGSDAEVVLSAADLDLIEGRPEGLVVANTLRTTDWTVRMEATR
uniref:hypothetical protein n=1 Tax=Paractinoplanes polyasparticus TaxID=2856853 RepID=UPI001C863636|nr:hypothetical protein [Actinoplanes polyasparticus]